MTPPRDQQSETRYLSDCCNAEPWGGLSDRDGTRYGRCSTCEQRISFHASANKEQKVGKWSWFGAAQSGFGLTNGEGKNIGVRMSREAAEKVVMEVNAALTAHDEALPGIKKEASDG